MTPSTSDSSEGEQFFAVSSHKCKLCEKNTGGSTSGPQISSKSIVGCTLSDHARLNTGEVHEENHNYTQNNRIALINADGVSSRRRQPSSKERCRRELALTIPSEDRGRIATAKGNAAAGSCKWIEEVQQFNEWFQGENRFLWVFGGPGKGKTFLAIYIVRNLVRIKSKLDPELSREPLILEYYCDSSDSRRNTALCVLRGLLYQLLDADDKLYGLILPDFNDPGQGPEGLFCETHIEKLWRIFLRMLSKLQRQVYLVLDGLDECNSKSIRFIRIKLEELHEVAEVDLRNISTILVSRKTLDENVRLAQTIDLDTGFIKERDDDIKLFVSDSIAQLGLHMDQRSPLEDIFQTRANGTYLWVALALSVLKKERAETIQRILESRHAIEEWIPVGLDGAYTRILLTIPEDEIELSAKIIHCLSLAYRPLSEAEITAMTQSQEVQVRIQMKKLANLLSHATDGRFQLVHLSLKEYLQRVPFFGISESAPAMNLSLLHVVLFILNKRFVCCMLDLFLFSVILTVAHALLGCTPVSHTLPIFLTIAAASMALFSIGKLSITFKVLPPCQRRLTVSVFKFRGQEAHRQLLATLLDLMKTYFQDESRYIPEPGLLAAEIKDVVLEKNIPTYIQYGCQYWIKHLLDSNFELIDHGVIHSFLKDTFLCWLETVGLMKIVGEAVMSVISLSSKTSVKGDRDLHAFVRDARKFMLRSRGAIEAAPRQAFISSLVFAPRSSIVQQQFKKHMPDWLLRSPVMQDTEINWLLSLGGHQDSINSVTFSEPSAVPNETLLLASASKDNTVRIWDVSSGSLLRTLDGHTGWVTTVAFMTATSSTEKKLIASASSDGTVRLWNVNSGLPEKKFEYSASKVTPVFTTAPDGRNLFAFVAEDYIVELWDVDTCSMLKRLEGDKGESYNIMVCSTMAPSSHILAAASDNGVVRLWEVGSGLQLPSVELSGPEVRCMALSASVIDGGKHYLAIHSFAKSGYELQLWEVSLTLDPPRLLWKYIDTGHIDTLKFVTPVEPGEKLLLASTSRSSMRFWEVEGGSDGPPLPQVLENEQKPVECVAFSKAIGGERFLACGYGSGTLRLWDTSSSSDSLCTKRAPWSGSAEVESVPFSGEVYALCRKQLVAKTDDFGVQLWNVAPIPPQQLTKLKTKFMAVTSAAISTPVADRGQLLAIAKGGSGGIIELWDLAMEPPLQLHALDCRLPVYSGCSHLTFSKPTAAGNYDRLLLASAWFTEKSIYLWNLSANPPELLYVLENHKEAVLSLAFDTTSLDGTQLLASSSSDGTTILFRIDLDGPAVLQERQMEEIAAPLAFANNRQRIETGHGPLELDLSPAAGNRCLYVYKRDEWLMCGNRRLVWLPPGYRGDNQAWQDNVLVVGHRSSAGTVGRMNLWELDLEKLRS